MRDIEYIDNKHRIVDDHNLCYPQYKGWFFWHNYEYTIASRTFKHKFESKSDARYFLLKKIYGDKHDNKSR